MWRHFSTPHLHLLSGACCTAESFVNNGVTLLDKLLILVPQASFFCIMLLKKKKKKKRKKKEKKEFPYHTAYMPISINQWMADIYISQEEKGKNRSYTLFLHIFINHISAFWVPSVYKAIMMQTSMFLERQMWSLWLKASTTLICHSCAYNKKNTKNKRPVNKCSELWKSMCTTKEFSFVESFYIFNIILQKVMSPLFVIKQWTAS